MTLQWLPQKKLGVSSAMLTRWKQGMPPDAHAAVALARIYGGSPLQALVAAGGLYFLTTPGGFLARLRRGSVSPLKMFLSVSFWMRSRYAFTSLNPPSGILMCWILCRVIGASRLREENEVFCGDGNNPWAYHCRYRHRSWIFSHGVFGAVLYKWDSTCRVLVFSSFVADSHHL